MPHGFLNFDAPNGMKLAKKCVKDAAGLIYQSFINSNNKSFIIWKLLWKAS